MMSDDFRQYAELWQEQIAPEEVAQLQAMARDIERIARWKRLLDLSLALAFIGLAGLALWIYPASLQAKFGFALLAAMVMWGLWRRHQITRASRATAIHDPRVFFEKTIKNVRAEINLSTTSFCLMVPAVVFCFFLISAVRGLDVVELVRLELSSKSLTKTVFVLTIWLMALAYFVRDNIKLREQLRRLESMSREWDDHPGRDLDGP